MADYCEVCGNDPCVCDDGFSIKEGADDVLDEVLDDAIGADEEVLLAETDPSAIDPFASEQEKDPYFDDEEDDSIDLPYTDEENLI